MSKRQRKLIGLDREMAKNASGASLGEKTLRANQIEFINLIIGHLTERLLNDSPPRQVTFWTS
jgi:hypothetical protein